MPAVLSCQPLPVLGSLPQCSPLRSPLFAAAGALAASNCDDALATPPLLTKAKFVVVPGEGLGLGVGVGVGVGEPPELQASTSMMRLWLASPLFTDTLILLVVMAGKVNERFTLLLPVTLPPGTVTKFAPSQYCTSKAVIP